MAIVEAAGTTFGYEEHGEGDDVVIFMHGYLGTKDIWSVVAKSLHGYRRICLDARGVGQSGRPADGYTVDGWAADIEAVADALGVGSFRYVGHSMGSLAGYRLALTRPDRVRQLVVVCPAPAGPPRAGRDAFARFRQAWAANDGSAMASLLASTSVQLPDSALTTRRGEAATTASEGHVDSLLDAVVTLELRPELPALSTPTLLMVGAADPALRTCLSDFQMLPAATIEVLSGVGHVPQLEAPGRVTDVLQRFFADGVIDFATLMERMSANQSAMNRSQAHHVNRAASRSAGPSRT
ncbi:alpha/beta fold hydrolase [Streptomyces sp. NPDC001978]|uniref:alpha/beta fold hydrolase n=1 Tax=Streptomyces sp. NPDC001978 TaxID=3364627 RepID=UPI0036747E68